MRDTVDEILARLDAKPEKKDARVPRPKVKAPPVQEDETWRSEPLLGSGDQSNVGLLGLPLPVVEDGLSAIMNLLRAPGPFPNGLRHGLTEELAAHGQHGDTLMAHLTPGEVVVPKNLQTPEVMAVLAKAARAKGISLAQYQVGAQQNQINPRTGAPAFAEIHAHYNVDGDGSEDGDGFEGGSANDDGNNPAAGNGSSLDGVATAPTQEIEGITIKGKPEPTGDPVIDPGSPPLDDDPGIIWTEPRNFADPNSLDPRMSHGENPNPGNYNAPNDLDGAQQRERFYQQVLAARQSGQAQLPVTNDPAARTDLQNKLDSFGTLLDSLQLQHSIDTAFLKNYTKSA